MEQCVRARRKAPRAAGERTAGWPAARSYDADSPLLWSEVGLAKAREDGPHGFTALRRKMNAYPANGARLGWLLLPEGQAVEIWRGGQQGLAEQITNANRLEGGELAEGLALELEEIWTV